MLSLAAIENAGQDIKKAAIKIVYQFKPQNGRKLNNRGEGRPLNYIVKPSGLTDAYLARPMPQILHARLGQDADSSYKMVIFQQ